MDMPTHRQQFSALVQAQTTVISALPYLLGCAFTYFYYHHFNGVDTILLFIAVISFHLAVNGHNQYTDYRRFNDSGSVSENNIIAKFKIALPWARLMIGTLVLVASVIGIYLTFKAGWPLLLIGILSFLIGYAYSGGPYPILKTPLGEPVSGITMGYNITLLAIYINIYNSPQFDPFFWLKGLLIALPAILVISNVMLGNNICDRDEDVQIGKRTLVYYIGRPASMKVLITCYALSYLMIITAVVLRYLPLLTLLSLITIPLVYRRIKAFVNHPDKMTTFFNILISLQLILISEIVFTGIGILINH